MTNPPKITLAYHRPVAARKRRNVIRVSLLVFLAAAVWYAGPKVWDHWQLLARERAVAGYVPADPAAWIDPSRSNVGGPTPAAKRVAAESGSLLRPDTSILFLHQLHRPDGERRLVQIGMTPETRFGQFVVVTVSQPARLFSALGLDTVDYPASLPTFVLFREGRIDPNDPTHFTIDFQDGDGMTKTLDGWLGNDDRVRFGVRGGK